jgi:hypothetical protein
LLQVQRTPNAMSFSAWFQSWMQWVFRHDFIVQLFSCSTLHRCVIMFLNKTRNGQGNERKWCSKNSRWADSPPGLRAFWHKARKEKPEIERDTCEQHES